MQTPRVVLLSDASQQDRYKNLAAALEANSSSGVGWIGGVSQDGEPITICRDEKSREAFNTFLASKTAHQS